MKKYSPEQKSEFLEQLLGIEPGSITRDQIVYFISRSIQDDGLYEPRLYHTDYFKLPESRLKCAKSSFLTTVGRYLFNSCCIEVAFGDSIDYFNQHLGPDNIGIIDKTISESLIDKKITVKQYRVFATRLPWFTYAVSEMVMPGMSMKLVGLDPEMQKVKKQILDENKEIVNKRDLVGFKEKIEIPLVKKYLERHKDNPALQLYGSDMKPTINNSLMKCNIIGGILPDKLLGQEYNINTRSYVDGCSPSIMASLGNETVHGSVKRSIEVRDGGATVKYYIGAMQGELLGKKGSDCGTKLAREVYIDESNFNDYVNLYAMTKDNKPVKITKDIKDKIINRKVRVRSLLYCRSTPYCNHCAGDYFYDLNSKAIGIHAIKTGSVLMYVSMKAMHDSTVKLVNVNPWEYMFDNRELRHARKSIEKSRIIQQRKR